MKRNFTLIILALVSLALRAQTTFQNSEFMLNQLAVSPSYTGFNGDHEIFANYMNHFTGLPGAPVSVWADYNGIVKGNSGLGAMIGYEKFGLFRNIRANISYAYHLHFGKDQRLSLGLNFSLNQTQLDFANSNSDPLNDPGIMLSNVKSGIAFNSGVGLSYAYKQLSISVCAPFIINNVRNKLYTAYSQPQQLCYYASYNLVINKTWSIKPAVVVNQVFHAPVNYMGVISTRFRDFVWLNLGYAAQTKISAGVGAMVVKRLTVQYTYQFGFQGAIGASTGSHELTLGVLIGKPNGKWLNNSVFGNVRKTPYYEWE